MGSLTVKHLESCTVMLNIEKKDKAIFFLFLFFWIVLFCFQQMADSCSRGSKTRHNRIEILLVMKKDPRGFGMFL